MWRLWLATGLVTIGITTAHAEVRTQRVAYKDGETRLQGYLAWDASLEGKRPGVLVVHEWWGLDEYAHSRAEQLAKLGYVAFALDMYGQGKVTQHAKQAGAWSSEIRENVQAWRQRAVAGLNILRGHALVDTGRLAAIGYCFGGATVMQMAYAGVDLRGVVSFHGSLPVLEGDGDRVKAKLLVCHGAQDAFIPEEKAQQFRDALDKADVDYQMIYYGGARHSFTNPHADEHGIENVKYNPKADARSWQHMQKFFDQLFAPAPPRPAEK